MISTHARIYRGQTIGLAPIVVSAMFAAFGLYLGDRMSLYAAAFFGVCAIGGLALYVRMRSGKGPYEELSVDDIGVTRLAPQLREHIAWADVSRVRILTTDQGPQSEDVFFVMDGRSGAGCVVPHDLAVEGKLLDALQEKLPGVNNGSVIEAMTSTSNREFVIWEAKSDA
ncbi:MAG TPA: hypothetical protein VJR92_06435 [Gemmatimonadaceae bacterium]|nr:hypothetical protein [Gemmatimonadaceae bacterium]